MHPTQTQTGKPKKKPCCKSLWKKAPWENGALLTEYQKEYYEKMMHGAAPEKVSPMQPSLKTGGAFEGNTTYHSNYVTWEPSYAGQVRPKHAFSGSTDPLDPWTTYKVDYPAKAVPYERVKPANAIAASAGAFDDTTTNKNDFKDPGPTKPVASFQSRSVSVPRGTGVFEGASLYKDDYKRHPLVRSMAAVPAKGSNAALPKGAFDDSTMYKTSFTPKGYGPAARFRPENSTYMPDGWYEGMAPSTEYKDHYFGKAGGPAQKCGPTTGASGQVMPGGNFDGRTTYGGDFRPMTAPGYVRARPPNNANDQDYMPFEGQTTYHGDFTKKAVPYSRVKPTNAFQPNTDKFDDTTTHNSAFKNPGVTQVVHPTRGINSIGKETGPFEGQSTYKHDYIKMMAARSKQAGRPLSGTRQLQPKGPFDDTTTYKRDFMNKELQPWERARPTTAYCESCDDSPECQDDAETQAYLDSKRMW